MAGCSSCHDYEKPTETYRGPLAVKTDEIGDDWVRITLAIPGVKKRGFFHIRKGNTEVDLKLEEQSFKCFATIQVEKRPKLSTPSNPLGVKTDKYFYQVKRLPDFIDPEHSSFKVRNGRVEINLKKKVRRSWAPELCTGGLETANDDEDSS